MATKAATTTTTKTGTKAATKSARRRARAIEVDDSNPYARDKTLDPFR